MSRRPNLPLFNREIRAIVGPAIGTGIVIENLKMNFKVKKTDSEDPNNLDMEIYNLTENTISKISEENNIIVVEAGYKDENNTEVVYIGDISSVYTSRIPPDKITYIKAGDGEKNINEKNISVAYGAGVNTNQILNDAARELGLAIKTPIENISKFIPFANAFSFGGKVKTLLDNVTESAGLKWSVQNHELKIYDENGSDNRFLISLSPETGLIGSPEKIRIKTRRRTKQKTINGYRIKALLNPKAEPGGLIRVTSRDIDDGQFRIINCNFDADNFEGDFVMVLEVAE
jgi:hypothetical protein